MDGDDADYRRHGHGDGAAYTDMGGGMKSSAEGRRHTKASGAVPILNSADFGGIIAIDDRPQIAVIQQSYSYTARVDRQNMNYHYISADSSVTMG